MVDRFPEPFQTALARGRPLDVCDTEVTSAQTRFARGLARMQVGRDEAARSDFDAAKAELGDRCLIEIAHLDTRHSRNLEEASRIAKEIAGRAEPDGILMGRALHIMGLAEGKLRHINASVDALWDAVRIFRSRDEKDYHAQVLDTFGMVLAAEGRLDHALSYFGMSLSLKSLVQDRYGMAITLGNMGRVHLRFGRLQDAIDCFLADLGIAIEIGDRRGEARMRNDLGRAMLELRDLESAEKELCLCLELALQLEDKDLEFFARKDHVYLLLAREDLDAAKTHLEEAERFANEARSSFYAALVKAARGDFHLACREELKALPLLRDAAKSFDAEQLPDYHIPTLISLSRAANALGYHLTAEHCLSRALKHSSHDGYTRYLPSIREAMAELSIKEELTEETSRLDASADAEPTLDGYHILGPLGSGGFGEVYRAFDPQRHRIVALKVLHLEGLYDLDDRRRLLTSMRMELDVASRIRHPGIARVFAIGTDVNGRFYICQEFVEGPSLDKMLGTGEKADIDTVMNGVGKLAHALQVLHENGIVHGDLKPANILLRSTTRDPVLVDFGVACFFKGKGSLKESGHVIGTPSYMAPEQASGAPLDGRADCYALGVIMFQWLTGRLPIPLRGVKTAELAHVLSSRSPLPIHDLRPDLAEEVCRLVNEMLAKSPGERPDGSAIAARCRHGR
ncbi:MAG: protein kinase [Planctomycetota bacterium]